jgi:hypothetical protein
LNKLILFSWENGKYISIGNLFVEVINKTECFYEVKKVYSDSLYYLIIDDDKYSCRIHLEDAVQDLKFKQLNKTKEDYKHLTLNSILSFEECVFCFRTITGPNSFGGKYYVENKMKEIKDKYSIREIIEMTKDDIYLRYESERFKEFFEK